MSDKGNPDFVAFLKAVRRKSFAQMVRDHPESVEPCEFCGLTGLRFCDFYKDPWPTDYTATCFDHSSWGMD